MHTLALRVVHCMKQLEGAVRIQAFTLCSGSIAPQLLQHKYALAWQKAQLLAVTKLVSAQQCHDKKCNLWFAPDLG